MDDQWRHPTNSVPAQWYAIRSKANKEGPLYRELLARDYQVFFPQLQVNPVNPRSRKLVPYFPGYMFVHVNLEISGTAPLNRIPDAIGLVMFDDYVPPVAESLLRQIDRKLAAIAEAGGQTFFEIHPGDSIEITGGAFAGYEAVFEERLQGEERVRILLKMLSDRYVPTIIHAGLVKKRGR
jgi:transcriptional antiterminator RfaH